MSGRPEPRAFKAVLGPADAGGFKLVWLHGWGHDHRHLLALARLFGGDFRSVLFDLPGFGKTPPLEPGAGTMRYAEWLAGELQDEKGKIVLACHSFGCRVAMRFAAAWPEKVAGLMLIAAPGLPRRRGPLWRLKTAALKALGKAAGAADRVFKTRLKEAYRNRFGSPDYRAAGALRETLVATVTEDLTETAKRCRLPVLMIYGEGDLETPPGLGHGFKALMPHAELVVLPGLDHYNVLSRGVFRCEHLMRGFLGAVNRDA